MVGDADLWTTDVAKGFGALLRKMHALHLTSVAVNSGSENETARAASARAASSTMPSNTSNAAGSSLGAGAGAGAGIGPGPGAGAGPPPPKLSAAALHALHDKRDEDLSPEEAHAKYAALCHLWQASIVKRAATIDSMVDNSPARQRARFLRRIFGPKYRIHPQQRSR